MPPKLPGASFPFSTVRCGFAVPLTCAGRPWRRLQVGSDGALLGCYGGAVVGNHRCRSVVRAAASAARTAAGSAPTAAATWRATVAQRGGRRLLGVVVGHSVQARTIRSSGVARMVAATLFACARLLYGFALSTKTVPERNQT